MLSRIITRFTTWILSTSVYMGLCAIALCIAAEKLILGYVPPFFSPLHAVIVGSTLLEYNVHHLFNAHGADGWSRHARLWHWVMIIAGLTLCGISIPFLNMQVLLACTVLGGLAFAYSTPLLPFRYKRRLKDFGIIKISVLTMTWVVATTVIPVLYWQQPFRYLWLEIACRILLIFPLCLAFDIRDVQPDRAAGIDTVPTSLGEQATYRLINISLLLFVVEGILQYFRRWEIMHVASVVISAVVAWWAINFARRRPHPFAFLGLVDGVMLLYGLLELM